MYDGQKHESVIFSRIVTGRDMAKNKQLPVMLFIKDEESDDHKIIQ
jgi:hypothetical protein